MRRSILCFLCLLIAGPALAGPKTNVSVLFQDFPKGTECSVSQAKGKVKVTKRRGHPKVEVKGFGEIGDFFCRLPDGRTVVTDVNKRLPADANIAGITVYPDGRAFVTTSTGGNLVQLQFTGTLK